MPKVIIIAVNPEIIVACSSLVEVKEGLKFAGCFKNRNLYGVSVQCVIVFVSRRNRNGCRTNANKCQLAESIDNDNFFFVEQTLGDIVADLRRHFAVEIVVTDKSLCDETYYASFVNEESLDEILDALNKDRLFSVRREAEVYYISPPLK